MLNRSWRYLAALGIVATSTLAAELLYRLFDTNRLSMVFLAGVLVAAVTLGSGPAYFAAGLAFVIYNIYLVEPRFTFQLASPEDILLLIVFAAVAVLTGRLAGQVRDEEQRAASRARTAASLFEASQDLSSLDTEAALRERLAAHIARAAKGYAAVWDLEGPIHSSPVAEAPEELQDLIQAWRSSAGTVPDRQALGAWRVRPLRANDEILGAAAWRSLDRGDQDLEEPLIRVLADLGAAALARARLAGVRADVEAAARTAQLRNALLSSISHDLRTPLAAILASASSLREFGDQFSGAVRSDLVLTIEEEADRLNRFVANLLNMTKLESGALTLNLVPVDVGELVDQVVRRVEPRLGGRQILRTLPSGLGVLGDPMLLEQAIGNVLENALRFTPDPSEITLRAWREGSASYVEIADEGPGVPTDELHLIFGKFYRATSIGADRQGTGLGLSITQGLVSAMHGDVAAGRRSDGRSGLVVTITLPSAAP